MANFARYEQGGYGEDGLPDYIYYNGDVINNRTDDFDTNGLAYKDPFIQFNETRDAALVKDASKYHFSIVRFAMNGPSKAIPLFIPNIQSGTTQTQSGVTVNTAAAGSVDLTNYGAAIAYQQTWEFTTSAANTVNVTFSVVPPITYMEYVTEFDNLIVAPIPNLPILNQDLNPNSKYYNCYSYQSVVDMLNTTFTNSLYVTWQKLNAAYLVVVGASPPWTTPYVTVSVVPALGVGETLLPIANSGLASFDYFIGNSGTNTAISAITAAPQLVFNPTTNLFTFFAPAWGGYGASVEAYEPPSAGVNSAAIGAANCQLFVNNNMWGLIGNYPFKYTNAPQYPVFGGITLDVPEGYVFQLILGNRFYQNVVDFSTPQYPDGTTTYLGQGNLTGPWWSCIQDFKTVDQLWSPVASIVFTTGLIPIRSEATGQPVVTGTSNTSISAPTSQSAFQPIITDVVLPMTDGASDYCGFVYYAPQAEYRMSSLANSPIDIRSIDLQVFYRNRLNNTLYPISMFNLSNVSFKIMFRHKRLAGYKG